VRPDLLFAELMIFVQGTATGLEAAIVADVFPLHIGSRSIFD